jgi:hypothetical protein
MTETEPALHDDPTEGRRKLIVAILFGAVIALIAANIYLFIRLDRLESTVAKGQENLLKELTEQRKSSTVTSASYKQRMETLQAELEAARRQATLAAGQAKSDAQARAQQLEGQLRVLADEQRKTEAELRTEVQEVASTADKRIEGVSTDVASVRTEVATTKSELEKTIAELKRTNGDMGVMSGLIATNAKELAALRQLGERNYFEFNLGKTKEPQKVGDISLKLRRTDTKRNRYTLEVYADDKKVEKKDKNVNEPVQFYVSKARQPYELVVNQIRKDAVVGYLSTPKVMVAR